MNVGKKSKEFGGTAARMTPEGRTSRPNYAPSCQPPRAKQTPIRLRFRLAQFQLSSRHSVMRLGRTGWREGRSRSVNTYEQHSVTKRVEAYVAVDLGYDRISSIRKLIGSFLFITRLLLHDQLVYVFNAIILSVMDYMPALFFCVVEAVPILNFYVSVNELSENTRI